MEYHRPDQIDEAKKLLARDGTKPILIHPRRDVEPYSTADAAVDLSRLNLNYIKRDGDVIRIGVMTTLQDVADSPLLRTVARGILPEAASLTAHLGLRNASTIGGVIENPSSAVDVMLALLALGVGATPSDASPLQSEISFSCSPQARGALERIARTPKDAPIVAACGVMDEGNKMMRIAVGGVGIAPTLVDATDPQSSISPAADFRGRVEYQREMAGVLVKRVLERLTK